MARIELRKLYPSLHRLWLPGFVARARWLKGRLIWLACGTEDRVIASHRQSEAWLKGKGVTFSSKETPGAHTWMVWRRYLTDLAPLLFREGKS